MRLSRSWKLVYLATFALPAVLLVSSLRTFREMEAQREVYLRERVAVIAGRLEGAATRQEELAAAIVSLLDEEPHLLGLTVRTRADSSHDPALESIWNGRELFRTRFVEAGGARIYRAYIPFHTGGVMQVAQIDLDTAASDFLLVHARHNVIVSMVGSLAVIALAFYSIWASRRAAQLEARQLELQHLARLGTMSAVLAHEIRNPLGTIKGYVQLAAEQAPGTVSRLLAPVVDQVARLERLVKDLLVYGRPPVPSLRTVAWSEMTARLRTAAGSLAPAAEGHLELSAAEIAFETDPDLLEQILVNLLRNAWDAVEPLADGHIAITAAEEKGGVRIAVRDNGPGIAPADAARVCEPFFTTKSFGTGLGLPICRRLAEALGGSLEIGPAAGAGAEIVLRLRRKTEAWNRS